MATTEIPKNAGETLRVERGEHQGIDLLHVRVWTGRPGDPNAKPTQKGLSLRPEVWREVLPAVAKLLEGGGDNGATE
jgi:hypothetical protein